MSGYIFAISDKRFLIGDQEPEMLIIEKDRIVFRTTKPMWIDSKPLRKPRMFGFPVIENMTHVISPIH